MKNLQPVNSLYETTIRLMVLLFVIAWCLMIMYPFLSIILWSATLSMALLPLHKILAQKFKGKPKTASIVIVFGILVLLLLPSGMLMFSVVDEVATLKTLYKNGMLTIPSPNVKVKDWPVIGEKLYDTWYAASVNLKQLIIEHKDQIIEPAKKIAHSLLGVIGGIFMITVSTIIAGILLTVEGLGNSLRNFFRKLIGSRGDEFADITVKTVSSVVKGILGVAVLVALLHAAIFLLAGIPFAGILTLLIFILCVLQIPAIIVTLPVFIYLFSEKEPLVAVLWSILLVIAGLSDNVLKPLLLSKGASVPTLVIFIGVVGGFILSGFIGLFTGAIVMSLGYKLFEGWMQSNNEDVVN